MDTTEQSDIYGASEGTGVTRRRVLQGSALGAVVWATPAVTTLGARAFAAVGSQAPAAGRLDTTNNGGAYGHHYQLSFVCSGSVVTFTGTGTADAGDNDGEDITGSIDLDALTFTLTSVYRRSDGYSYSLAGPLTSTGAGSYSYSGLSGTGGVADASGTFRGVPRCG